MFGSAAILGSVGGSLISGMFNRSTARENTAANIEAMKSRHQWEVDDLKKAGLNPILSAKLGGSQGMPAVAAAPMGDLGSALTQGIQADATAQKLPEEIKALQQQYQLTNQQAWRATQEAEKIIKEMKILDEQRTQQENETYISQKVREYYEAHPEALRNARAIRSGGSGFFDMMINWVSRLVELDEGAR